MSGDGSEVVLTVRQTQSAEWPSFRLPMDVEIRLNGSPDIRLRESIELTSREQTFRLPVSGRPEAVTLDPDGWVLKGG